MPKKRQLNCGVCSSEKRIMILKNGKEKLVCDKCRNANAALWAKHNKFRVNEKNRLWVKNNHEQKQHTSRTSKLKLNYNITIEEYNKMLFNQNGVCKICNEKEIQKGKKGTEWSLSVDHCHITGKIRGLLCSRCNVGLSKFRDNIKYFESAINYLKTNCNENKTINPQQSIG